MKNSITFLELLAWMHCPMAASAGYVPVHPRGNEQLATKVLDTWPNDNSCLADFALSRKDANNWLQQSRFGLTRMLSSPIAPPEPLKIEAGYWIKGSRPLPYSGVLWVEGAGGETTAVHFELPYLHRVNGLYEIILMDVNVDPPTLQRRSDLLLEGAFLADAFRLLTGQFAGLRLVAPGYEHEETLHLPHQHLDSLIELVRIVHPIGFIRPGAYCNHRMRPPHTTQWRWRCPVREAELCEPFNPNHRNR